MILDDSSDNTKQGLQDKPWNIKQAGRDSETMVIFDRSQCIGLQSIGIDINNHNSVLKYFAENHKDWKSPPSIHNLKSDALRQSANAVFEASLQMYNKQPNKNEQQLTINFD